MGDRARKLKDKASKAFTEGRLKDALRLYGQVVEEEPNELGCRIKMGDILRRLDDEAAAVQAYRPVARAYAEDGFLLKAIAVCKLILSIESDHTDTQEMLADLYAKRRGATRPVTVSAPPPVTLRQMGVSVHPDRDVWSISREYGVRTNDPVAPQVTISVPAAAAPAAAIDVAGPMDLARGSVAGLPADCPAPGRGEHESEVGTSDAAAEFSGGVEPVLLQTRIDVQEDLEMLGRPHLPLFSELPKNAFIELLIKMEMRETESGEVLIREGDVGDSMFIVASGRVRVERLGEDGRPVVLAYLTDGAFFGEMALLQDGARTASVIVEDAAQIFTISKEVLDHVVRQFPSVAVVLRNFYRQRLLSTTLATHPLFSPFDADERRQLMEMFKSKSFEKDDVLLEQGKKATGLFVLLYGALDVVWEEEGKPPQRLAELRSGDLFGEISLLTNRPMTATVRATSPSFVLRLSRRKFDDVVMTHPQILDLVSRLSDARRQAEDPVVGQGDRDSWGLPV